MYARLLSISVSETIADRCREERSVEKLGCNLRAFVDVDDQRETKADDGGRVRLETCKSSAGLIR